ncbi:hypothetical protein [Deinococcus knuensis]|uniref:LamG domain-containing protein n=1 Tax=Deinococcus knuensis TaxID=1837380 RepID=A0ABQ2SH24_9DEIO|nr:hypothetical protein [Deinococcus knuensis]GGS26050.1 hypothetical protein GCM10008961_16950 [Deinococcus knuensis]
MTGIIQKLTNVTFTGSLPKLEYDQIIPPVGAKLLYDFGNPQTYGGTLPAGGATVANGTTLTNLVRGGANASISAQLGLTFTGGGLDWATAATGTDNYPRINLGAYDLTNRSFLWIGWVRSVGPASNRGIFGNVVSSSNANRGFSVGHKFGDSTTGAIDVSFYNQALTATGGSITAISVAGQVLQLALEINPAAGLIRRYVNAGQPNAPLTLPAGTTGINPASVNEPFAIGSLAGSGSGSKYTGRIYRMYVEDLTASGRTGADVVEKDYGYNAGRFS